ncbi:MAG: phenylacetate-CoA oxygenase subunit PaaI, partial [Phycisphaerales bacterium]|nr:phenylacetate-CoA oxygenase subunit PaaI [Phycisphaerales bacterium]
RCTAIVELTDEFNFGTALVRQFFCDHCDRLRLARLAASNHKPLADLAKRLLAEEQVHVEHVDGWIRRLGRGTTESRTHVQRALDALAPLAPGLFEPVDGEDALVADGRYPVVGADPFETWAAELRAVAQEAGLTLTLARWAPDRRGGRRGVHSDQLGPLLDEMCEVFRQEPTAAW